MPDRHETPHRGSTDIQQPFVNPDEARERPKTIDANAADVGGVADHFTDTASNLPDGDDFSGKEDGLPGEADAIYERGTTIRPPS